MSSRTFHTRYSTTVIEGNLGKQWRKRKQMHGRTRNHQEACVRSLGFTFFFDTKCVDDELVKFKSRRAELAWTDFDSNFDVVAGADIENEQILLDNDAYDTKLTEYETNEAYQAMWDERAEALDSAQDDLWLDDADEYSIPVMTEREVEEHFDSAFYSRGRHNAGYSVITL